MIQKLHKRAMDLAEMGFVARMHGNIDLARSFSERALCYERRAATIASESGGTEPTRSILYRSAGWLAYNAGKLADAKSLVEIGLQGDPPPEIRDELEELMDAINNHGCILHQIQHI